MEKMQTKVKLSSLRIAPRKVRLLIDLIRGMSVEKALHQLQFSKKDAAKPLIKLLNSGVANAKHNHEMKKETLVVKTAFVDGGPTLHRWTPRAMGRATPIRKRTSHITIILEGEAQKKKESKVKKSKVNGEVVEGALEQEKSDVKSKDVVEKKDTKEVKKKKVEKSIKKEDKLN